MPELQPILIASHPRSGTHLVLDLIRRQFKETRGRRLFGKPLDHLYLNLERLTSDNRPFTDAMAQKVLSKCSRPLMKTHYLADFSQTWVEEETGRLAAKWRRIADEAAVVYVHRDPREVMVSYKQFLSSTHPDVAAISLGDFLSRPHWTGTDTMLSWWVRHVEGWLSRPNILMLAYHNVVKRPEETLEAIANHTCLTPLMRKPLLPPKVTSVTRTRLDRLTSLAPASTAIIADRKRFPSVPWSKLADQQAEATLAAMAFETMARLGYSDASPL